MKRSSIGYKPKFIEPMLSDATSGFSCSAGCRRSSTSMVAAPPVVKLITTSLRRAMAGRELAEVLRVLRRPAVDRVARVQMDDRRARFGSGNGGILRSPSA